jgi:Amt family ammonium transporter
MNLIPGLSLRVPAEEEELGLDDGQLGEFAYDYVELTRHMADSTHPHSVASAQTSQEKIQGNA